MNTTDDYSMIDIPFSIPSGSHSPTVTNGSSLTAPIWTVDGVENQTSNPTVDNTVDPDDGGTPGEINGSVKIPSYESGIEIDFADLLVNVRNIKSVRKARLANAIGDLSEISSDIEDLEITGSSSVACSTQPDFGSTMERVVINAERMTQADVDRALAGLAQISTWVGAALVEIAGANAEPSPNGLTDKATIEGNGATVVVNTGTDPLFVFPTSPVTSEQFTIPVTFNFPAGVTSIRYDRLYNGNDPDQSVNATTSGTFNLPLDISGETATGGSGTVGVRISYWTNDDFNTQKFYPEEDQDPIFVDYDLPQIQSDVRQVHGTAALGSQWGHQNTRLFAWQFFANRVNVPFGFGGKTVDKIEVFALWRDGYGAGNRGTIRMNFHDNDNGNAPGTQGGNTAAIPISTFPLGTQTTGSNLNNLDIPLDLTTQYTLPADGQPFWIVAENVASTRANDNFSLNGHLSMPFNTADMIAPEDPDFVDLLSVNGSSWIPRSSTSRNFMYFQLFMTDGSTYGRIYSESDGRMGLSNSSSAFYINGTNQWRSRIETPALSDAKLHFAATRNNTGSAPLVVNIAGTDYQIPASQTPVAGLHYWHVSGGNIPYRELDNWVWHEVSLPNLPAGVHDIRWRTSSGTSYSLGIQKLRQGADQAEYGNGALASQISYNNGASWQNFLVYTSRSADARISNYISGV